jgi:hypothetical protein
MLSALDEDYTSEAEQVLEELSKMDVITKDLLLLAIQNIHLLCTQN